MSLLAPFALAFAAAIPVVILFYLLKRKRVVKLVSSTLLWQRFLSETQASKPFQKLRHNWLLVLQLALLVLAVLALARPFFTGKARPSQLRVMILDASASMQAKDEAPSRFEKARVEALKWVDSLRDQDKMVIVQAAANAEVKQSETSEKAALRRAIQACQPMDSPTRLVAALKMAESLVRDRPGAEIHLFSDGAVPELSEFENKNLPLVFHRIGQRCANLGLTALDVRANPDDPSQRALYTSVVNFSSNAVETVLELLFEGQPVAARPLNLGAGAASPQVFLTAQARDGVFTVRLKHDDDLAADNTASIVSLLPKPVKVLLVTAGNDHLQRALRVLPNVELSVARDLATPATEFDFTVLDEIVPTRWPAGNLLAVVVAPTNWFEAGRRIEAPVLIPWKGAHPLLRYVSWDNVSVAEALAVPPPSWAVSLLETTQGAVLLAGQFGRQRVVWVGFRTGAGTWPRRTSFPIFVANAVEWLNPASTRSAELLVRAGDPFRLPLTSPAREARVTLPDGAARTLPLDEQAAEVVFGETFRQGVYRLQVGTNETTFCVNLLDAAESHIQPRDELKLGQFARATAATAQRAGAEFWRWLAAAALAVLCFEWWWYHRRTA